MTEPLRVPGEPGGPCTYRGTRDTRCRCSPECRNRATKARAARAKRQGAGVPGRVPATRVRRHIRAFLAADRTRTVSDLARLAGVSRRTLALILDAPDDRTVNTTTARKVLAIPTDVALPGSPTVPVSGVEARRQVEALMVLGWPTTVIAERTGLHHSTLTAGNLLPTASPATVAAINGLFQRLRYTLGPSASTTSRAKRLGYLPWAAWSGRMADPTAVPDLSGMDPAWVAAYRARISGAQYSRPAQVA